MRESHPDWSPLGVNFKILDEHPYLFYISSPPPPPPPRDDFPYRFLVSMVLSWNGIQVAGRARNSPVFPLAHARVPITQVTLYLLEFCSLKLSDETMTSFTALHTGSEAKQIRQKNVNTH